MSGFSISAVKSIIVAVMIFLESPGKVEIYPGQSRDDANGLRAREEKKVCGL
jgi:hypothetical protein